VGLRAGLDVAEKGKNCPCRDSNPGLPAHRSSIYQLSYPDFYISVVRNLIKITLVFLEITGQRSLPHVFTLPGFEPGSGHVGFVADKVALGQVFSENFGFFLPICIPPIAPQSSSLSSGAGKIGQTVAAVPK
jgi:hypothetical protein